MTSLSAAIYRAEGDFPGCLSWRQAQTVQNTQTFNLQLQTGRTAKAGTVSAAAGVRTRVSHTKKRVLLYWPPRLCVIQQSHARDGVLLFCYSMRHADDESDYTSLAYTLLLCADLEMLSFNSSCVGTHPKQILQNLAKLAHANYGLMSTGLIFIHREARGRCCQKRCGQKDHFYRSEKLKVWWN